MEQNDQDHRFPRSGRILWGLFLIAMGCAFLLDRLGYVEIRALWNLWPVVFVVLAVGRALDRRPGAAASFAVMALAFFAAEFRWFGLSYRSFWPLLIVAVGVGIVLRTLSGEDGRAPRRAGAR